MNTEFKCTVNRCTRVFESAKALGAHKYRQHGIPGRKTKRLNKQSSNQNPPNLDEVLSVLYTKRDALQEVISIIEELKGIKV